MKIGRMTFTLEVADNIATQQRGLMQRDSMPEKHGMIFVFEDERPHEFHMQNTRIPLDILFVTGNGRVITLATMKPYDLSRTPSHGPVKYAIELNAGMANKAGVKVGDLLSIPADAKEPRL